jgi:hypothetical protein
MKRFLRYMQWVQAIITEMTAIGMFLSRGRAIIGGVIVFALAFAATPYFNKLIGHEDMPAKFVFLKAFAIFAAMLFAVDLFYVS